MSLDTVLQIGNFYRQDQFAWKYHEQINHVMKDVESISKNKDKDGNLITTYFYKIPVIDRGDEFLFDLENKSEIFDEDKKNSLYYLNFKTSKKDASKRYLFGDIIYSCYINQRGVLMENGNYRMNGNWSKKSSFWLCEDVAQNIDNQFIQKFRNEFRKKIKELEELLKSQNSIVLHFDFNGKRWLDLPDIINTIDNILTINLIKEHSEEDKVVLDKYLYKTLGGVTPGFNDANKYKNRLFTRDEIISLMYAGKASESPILRFGSIGIIALPHSEKLSSESVINFFERNTSFLDNNIDKEINKEDNVVDALEYEDSDPFFTDFINNDFDDMVKFDIVFTNIPASPAGVYADLIEVSNVEKSLLKYINKNIREKARETENMANSEFHNKKSNFHFHIGSSFKNIYGDITKEKKKFQFHLLKVLPQIYTDNYYEDPLLLPTFIDKVEYNIREGSQSFTTLKYDFYFLINIQKNNTLMKITESKSYALGKNLGIMAKQFAAWRDDCPIKSFEKSYVGNLSRRISSIEELVKFAAFINEKLVMHERLYPEVKNAYKNLVEVIENFSGEKYNKDYCALGFFTSYYETTSNVDKNSDINQLQK